MIFAPERGYHGHKTTDLIRAKIVFLLTQCHIGQIFVFVIGKCLLQSLVKCLSTHTTHGCKYHWGEEGAVLNIQYTFVVLPLFLFFVMTSQTFEIFEFLYLLAIGLNTLMSKNAYSN